MGCDVLGESFDWTYVMRFADWEKTKAAGRWGTVYWQASARTRSPACFLMSLSALIDVLRDSGFGLCAWNALN